MQIQKYNDITDLVLQLSIKKTESCVCVGFEPSRDDEGNILIYKSHSSANWRKTSKLEKSSPTSFEFVGVLWKLW